MECSLCHRKACRRDFSHGFHHLQVSVIYVPFGEIKRQNFSFIADYQVQFESQKPPQGALAQLGNAFESFHAGGFFCFGRIGAAWNPRS